MCLYSTYVHKSFLNYNFRGGKYMKEKKQQYERPVAQIIEFELEDHIAASADYGPNLSCSESVWE